MKHLFCGLVLICFLKLAEAAPKSDKSAPKHIANISYAIDNGKVPDLSALASIFSPRMDFDQWKPLTGRGDPLRNDPTYDYEPPVLERVHYWADDTRLEREHFPERKSEVLMLGVSSRRPSVVPRLPPPRRQRPQPLKYEDFSYKINDHYPMTILVPPPPPPPGHKPQVFVLSENKVIPPQVQPTPIKITEPTPTLVTKDTTSSPEHLTSVYAIQESNLIYQASTTSQNWLPNFNKTNTIPNAVSSDYVGWGPTTPTENIEIVNDTYNFILSDNIEESKRPYKFYKPMLSEAPPPPPLPTMSSIFLPTFVPTALPTTDTTLIPKVPHTTQHSVITTETSTNTVDNYEETTTENLNTKKYQGVVNHFTTVKPDKGMSSMLGPMMSMPLVNGPERLQDNLYAHASENLHIYKEHSTQDSIMETMQTMQPPPPARITESTTKPQYYETNPYLINNLAHNPSKFTHDPYLHMRFTTASPFTATHGDKDNIKSTTEIPPAAPMYLIIQGHSKVKTYSSKPNINDDHDTISNEIVNPNETTEVKHLHPINEKKTEKESYIRESRSKNLKSLVDENIGSIEIQEADVGIKYDVSDGSDVPIEIYRRGIVESGENDYSTLKKNSNERRTKRQFDLEDLLPFDDDAVEELVYKFVNDKRNSTGISGLLAQMVTSDEASEIDELDDDDDSEHDDETR